MIIAITPCNAVFALAPVTVNYMSCTYASGFPTSNISVVHETFGLIPKRMRITLASMAMRPASHSVKEEFVAMRTFTLGTGTDRKIVLVEVSGPRIGITESKPAGEIKRREREFSSDAAARSACDKMAQELISRG